MTMKQTADHAERVVEIVTLQVDRIALFDLMRSTGDGGEVVGMRLAGMLLGDDSLSTALGLACYGITRQHLMQSNQDRGEGDHG